MLHPARRIIGILSTVQTVGTCLATLVGRHTITHPTAGLASRLLIVYVQGEKDSRLYQLERAAGQPRALLWTEDKTVAINR